MLKTPKVTQLLHAVFELAQAVDFIGVFPCVIIEWE